MGNLAEKILLLRIGEGFEELLRAEARFPAEVILHPIPAIEQMDSELRRPDVLLDGLVIGTEIEDPIQTAQRAHTGNREVPILILSDAGKVRALEEAIRFAPFLGDEVSCLPVQEARQLPVMLSGMVTRAQARRSYRAKVSAANLALVTAEAPAPASYRHLYLDQLLDHAPIGIATLTPELRVLAWNRHAARITGISESALIGGSIKSVFPETSGESVTRLLKTQSAASIPPSIPTIISRTDTSGREQFLELTAKHTLGRGAQPGYLVIFQDVTERKRLEREQEARRQELQKALEARNEFLSIASHELKTPITSLQLQLEMLRRYSPQAGKERKTLEVAWHQIQRLTSLIDDLLDITRIEAGKLSYQFKDVDLCRLVTEIVERLIASWQEPASPIAIHPCRPLRASVDQRRMEQVLTNLVSNAMKYGSGKPVDVFVREENGEAVIEVRDQGIGIAEDQQERIFERFERAVPASHISGLGLGLYISREIVLAHGGRLRVQSELGKGSTFRVELPLLAPESK